MARTRTAAAVAGAEPILHLAARMEDSIHEFREKRARKRGYKATVIPYTSYGAKGWVRVLCRVLLTRPSPDGRVRYKKIRGWRSFTSVPVNDVDVTVTVGGKTHTVRADRGGVVDHELPVHLEPGWHTIAFTTEGSEPVEAPVFIVDPSAKVGIISDVDDTVMVTLLPRPFLAAWNTFVLDEHARIAVPGMAVLYDRLQQAHSGAPIFYLSTGAWNVAPTLTRFLSRNLYPAGPLLLTDWGPTRDRWFRSGRQHKTESLARLAKEFPDMQWLLVGDDGQHDEEIYREFSAGREEKIESVAIRQLSNSEAVLAGGRSKAEQHSGSGVRWVYAPDGAGLAEQLLDNLDSQAG
ncbi:MAG: synthase [Microbacteriaceae bacterium]|jgi:phosphatidate phosphatase APP1|nr:synthase [Microbacteriaceae bacterium]